MEKIEDSSISDCDKNNAGKNRTIKGHTTTSESSRMRSSSTRSRLSSGNNDSKRERNKHHHRQRSKYSSRPSSSSSSSSSSSCCTRRSPRPEEERRKHHRRRRRRKSPSTTSHSSSDSDYYHERRDYYYYKAVVHDDDSFQQVPNRTIMVRGLALHLTEEDIKGEVLRCGLVAKDIRLIRNHETGDSKGFAFVEFNYVAEATKWMDMKKGSLLLQDKFHAHLIYSNPKKKKKTSNSYEWTCESCERLNFQGRTLCYSCSTPKPIEKHLLNTENRTTTIIVLSNLDMYTTEERVLLALLQSSSQTNMACVPIKNVTIAREPGGSSVCCYVETNNITDSTALYNALSKEGGLEIDGRTVSVSYGKPVTNPMTMLIKNTDAGVAAMEAAKWTNNTTTTTTTTTGTGEVGSSSTTTCTSKEVKCEDDHDDDVNNNNNNNKMAEYYARAYAKTDEEYARYLDYYQQYFKKEGSTHPSSSTDSNNNKGVVDKQIGEFRTETPDMTRGYQYDTTSGYYYDPISGLYYDATTQYFYDAKKMQFLYWSPVEMKYIPVVGSGGGKEELKSVEDDETKVIGSRLKDDDKKKGDNKKVQNEVDKAREIVKKSEKWTKTWNQKKEQGFVPNNSVAFSSSSSSSSSSSFSVADKCNLKQKTTMMGSLKNGGGRSRGYATDTTTGCMISKTKVKETSYNYQMMMEDRGDDDDDDYTAKESLIIDESKLMCLLCKRKFFCANKLQRHIKFSDLHKKNLEGRKW